ncbi:hypothetical protein M0R45_036548 [Rubus argutus]|uniref:Uncharacterized protein n=1 Tax=Rubus argutus TaxID=59490 RepID=A0AAW1W1K2_RUBAR
MAAAWVEHDETVKVMAGLRKVAAWLWASGVGDDLRGLWVRERDRGRDDESTVVAGYRKGIRKKAMHGGI